MSVPMTRILTACLAFVVGSAIAPADNSRSLALSAVLQRHVDQGHVPAVAAIVVDRDRVRFVGAAGKRDVANNIDMTPDTIFRIASMTKPVTSLAIMMLAARCRHCKRLKSACVSLASP